MARPQGRPGEDIDRMRMPSRLPLVCASLSSNLPLSACVNLAPACTQPGSIR